MREIEFLCRVLNEKFLQEGCDALRMKEPADFSHDEQIVDISNRIKKITNMKLYCFNSDDTIESKLLPFFNKSDYAPKGLNCFCDYILLVQHESGPFIFLLELKTGTTEGGEEQLNASKTFMDYVLKSAERIKIANNYDDFDSKSIKFRRVIIKCERSNKSVTKRSDIQECDKNACLRHFYKQGIDFQPAWYCE